LRARRIYEPIQSDSARPVPFQKIFRFAARPNQIHILAIPSHKEGRFAIVTDVRRDAVDVAVSLTNGAKADGEVVWS